MAWFSILTNCYIFAFSSEQMEEWFPHFFVPDIPEHTQKLNLLQSGYEEIKTGKGRYVVFIMFGLEHLIGLICLCIHYFIPNITNNVNITMQRKQHVLHHQYIENIKKRSNELHKKLHSQK